MSKQLEQFATNPISASIFENMRDILMVQCVELDLVIACSKGAAPTMGVDPGDYLDIWGKASKDLWPADFVAFKESDEQLFPDGSEPLCKELFVDYTPPDGHMTHIVYCKKWGVVLEGDDGEPWRVTVTWAIDTTRLQMELCGSGGPQLEALRKDTDEIAGSMHKNLQMLQEIKALPNV